jgi:hypothetical protein
VVLAACGSFPSSAGAVDPLADPAPPPVVEAFDPGPLPRIRVSLARVAVLDARAELADEQRAAAGADADRAQAQAALDGARSAQADAERRLDLARDQLGSTAVYAYMNVPGGDDLASAVQGDATTRGEQRELFSASVDHHQQQVVDAEHAVARAGADLDRAEEDRERAQHAAADHDRRTEASASALADARDELRIAELEAVYPTTVASWQFTIEGPSAFTARELARWYDEQGHGSRASVPIADLARSYIRYGDAEGIRGDMAFAQAIHETGWFANNDTIAANNFAGIGHCSACAAGVPFGTADLGVLAQIQLLKSYAQPDPVYNEPRADPGLNGPIGCCPTWTALGGVWATDAGYGGRILGYYAAMLDWLVAVRTARFGLTFEST